VPGRRAVLTTALVWGYSPFLGSHITPCSPCPGIPNEANEPSRRGGLQRITEPGESRVPGLWRPLAAIQGGRRRGLSGPIRESRREASGRVAAIVSRPSTTPTSCDRLRGFLPRSLGEKSAFEEAVIGECRRPEGFSDLRESGARVRARLSSLELGKPLREKVAGMSYEPNQVAFERVGRWEAYAGLTARVRQSGGACCHGHISRQGSCRLRWILIQLAMMAIRRDMRLANFHTRIRKRSRAKIARVAAARELATI
jgi:hypothetical protein